MAPLKLLETEPPRGALWRSRLALALAAIVVLSSECRKEVGCHHGPDAWAQPRLAVLLRCERAAQFCLAPGGI
eukprot:1797738-Alexandrium_andersonii.AAC.1